MAMGELGGNESFGGKPGAMIEITREAAIVLDREFTLRDTDRSGNPHVLVKVPDLEKAAQAELGIEVRREEDGSVALSVLLFDIPTEPVNYEMRFIPSRHTDLVFLHSLIDTSRFRLHPCANVEGKWTVGEAQMLRIPPNLLLRLKHFSLEWPALESSEKAPEPVKAPPAPAVERAAPVGGELPLPDPPPAPARRAAPEGEVRSGPDPRDTIIRKLKEQAESLRAQMREKDKRIVELEEEVTRLSMKKPGRLSVEKKSWWKP